MMQFKDLEKQYRTLQPSIDQAMLQVAAQGQYVMGPQVKELERQLADYVGVKHCVTCANGTDALSLALKVWGIGPGDAVFVPDFTFFATAEVVAQEGATPVFVDVEESTFNMDAASLEACIRYVLNEGRLTPKAVIAVDLFGLPANYANIRRVVGEYGLLLLEDGAQGFGGSIGQQRACSFGDISTTSFFPAKPLGCYGDGGAVFTDNDEWASLIDSYRVHGKGKDKYDNVRIGRNSRLDTLQAAILQVKLRVFDHEVKQVNDAASTYTQMLSSYVGTPPIPDGFNSSRAQYTIRLSDEEQRNHLQQVLRAEGIPSMIYYPRPMHRQSAFKGLSQPGDCPSYNSVRLCSTVLSLPIHPYIERAEVERVCNVIHSVIEKK